MLKLTHIAAAAAFVIGAFLALPADAESPAGSDYGAVAIEQGDGSGGAPSIDLNAVLENLVIDGVVAGEALDDPEADGRAHGTKRLSRYPVCSKCGYLTCSLTRCTGHCRKNGRLFFCSGPRDPSVF